LRILKPTIDLTCDMAMMRPPALVNPHITGCGTKFMMNPRSGAPTDCTTPASSAMHEERTQYSSLYVNDSPLLHLYIDSELIHTYIPTYIINTYIHTYIHLHMHVQIKR
jgi:hypothetical protein